MSTGLDRQNKRIPFTLADAMHLMFSDNDPERKFMVRLWFQTRDLAAATSFTTHLKYDGGDRTKPKIFDGESLYPLDFGDGAIPIQLPSRYAPFSGGYLGNWNIKRAIDFGWTDDQYRRVLLVIRAVNTLPRCHGIELTSRFANRTKITSRVNSITPNTPTGESLSDVQPSSQPSNQVERHPKALRSLRGG